MGANAVLAIGDAPHGDKPLVEAKRAVLENRPDFIRKLLAAILATEHVAGFDFADTNAFCPTAWANDRARRPANLTHVGFADFAVGEVTDGFNQGLGGISHGARLSVPLSPLISGSLAPHSFVGNAGLARCRPGSGSLLAIPSATTIAVVIAGASTTAAGLRPTTIAGEMRPLVAGRAV